MKKKHYTLVYNYMIGDANGETKEKISISSDNPFAKRYCEILNRLKPTEKTWGICLNYETLNDFLEEKQINQDEYNFLNRTMFELGEDEPEEIKNYFKTKEENDYADEFNEGVRSENEYSFLVFEGIKLLKK